MYLKIFLFCLLYQSFNILLMANQVECGLMLWEWENKFPWRWHTKKKVTLIHNKIVCKYLRSPVR